MDQFDLRVLYLSQLTSTLPDSYNRVDYIIHCNFLNRTLDFKIPTKEFCFEEPEVPSKIIEIYTDFSNQCIAYQAEAIHCKNCFLLGMPKGTTLQLMISARAGGLSRRNILCSPSYVSTLLL